MTKKNLFIALGLVAFVSIGAGCTGEGDLEGEFSDPLIIDDSVSVVEDDANLEETGQVSVEGESEGEQGLIDIDLDVEAEGSVSVPVALEIAMESGNFFFEPAIITASPGQEVKITISENSGMHTFVIDEINFKQTVEAGAILSFTAPETTGRYSYYCDIGPHRQLGMEGVLVVE